MYPTQDISLTFLNFCPFLSPWFQHKWPLCLLYFFREVLEVFLTEFRHLSVLFSSASFLSWLPSVCCFFFASERHCCMLKCHLKEGYIVSPILASSFCSQGTAFTLLNIIYQWLTHNMQCITPCIYFPSWPLWISASLFHIAHTHRVWDTQEQGILLVLCTLFRG